MNVLIVEDEDLAVRKIRKLLLDIDPSLNIAGVTASIEETVAYLSDTETNETLDLIFMDIELADGQSFEIFDQVEVKSTVIFTTSYDEYALQAFKVNSIDYLLKPIQKEDLERSLKKFRDLAARRTPAEPGSATTINLNKLLRELQIQQPKEHRRRFLVRQGQRLLSIEVNEIAFFYTEERFSFFKTWQNQKFLVDYTLDELAEALDPVQFFRVNRGLIITHNAIEQIQPYFGNRLALTLRPTFEKEALVSREKVADFKVFMGK